MTKLLTTFQNSLAGIWQDLSLMFSSTPGATGESGIVVIGPWQLLLTGVFVAVVVLVIHLMNLGLKKEFLIATLRTYIQVMLLGVVLAFILKSSNVWLVLAVVVFMAATAARIVNSRVKRLPNPITKPAFIVLLSSSLIITFVVTHFVVGAKPWYDPSYFILIAGMVLGNSISGMAVAIERLFGDLDLRADEIRALIALGATPWEASQSSVRSSLRAGVIPSINTLSAAGVVFIPGTMAGLVLAGASPIHAAPYQILILVMIACADILGSTGLILMTYKRHFSANGAFVDYGSEVE